MRIILFIILLSISFSLRATSLNESIRKVGAHLMVHDHERALSLAKELFLAHSEDLKVHKSYLRALAFCRDEKLWYREWQNFKKNHAEEAYEVGVLEDVSWALLERARLSTSAQVRQLGLIAAGLTRDVRSVPLILAGLQDSNGSVRAIAVEMAAMYGDAPLKKALVIAYQKESHRTVRASLIRSFGRLQMKEMASSLRATLEEGRCDTEEQHALVESLVLLSRGMNEEELIRLAHAKRFSLRRVASEVIAHYEMRDQASLLWHLAHDSHPEVSASALKALGILRIEEVEGQPITSLLTPFLDSPHPPVSIVACWLAKLQGDVRADAILTRLVKEGEEESSVLAASAIATLGPYGIDLAKSLLDEVKDPFVRANLALALVGERHHPEIACQIFAELLRDNKERWMAEPLLGGLFAPLKRSNLPHQRGIAHYPEVVSQVIKLQMVGLLVVLEYEGAELLLKEFLAQKRWQVTGLAAELLLEAGDEEAILCVKGLLDDADPLIGLEAALVLATWGQDESALPYLMRGYEGAKLEMKVKILEALSRIKEKSTIPFLVDCLNESSQLVRIIAASVLLQTLNN